MYFKCTPIELPLFKFLVSLYKSSINYSNISNLEKLYKIKIKYYRRVLSPRQYLLLFQKVISSCYH
nr:MAG TPA: hypothetical protein [Caudoviricetes sp.]